jgi:serine/threonine protein kinase
MPLPTGSKIGPYEIVALLGSGGMGDVYRARDTRLNRHVAIEFVADAIADPLAISRFQRASRSPALALRHIDILT